MKRGLRRDRRRSFTLRASLLMWQLGTLLTLVVIVMATLGVVQWFQLRDAYMARTLGVAQAVAELPMIREAYLAEDPSQEIQPMAELIREASNMTFIVVTDGEGIRYSHPDENRIGERVSSEPVAAQSGEIFTGVEDGTLGYTLRAKVPVVDIDENVLGQVSVGILFAELRQDILKSVPLQVTVVLLTALIGAVSAAATMRIFHRRTLGLDPEQIAALLEEREAILKGSHDAIIGADTAGRIILVNDSAREMLQLSVDAAVEGLIVEDLLPSQLLRVWRVADSSEQLALVGERRVVVHAESVFYEDEEVGVVLVMRDHTELHETLMELEGAQSLTKRLQTQTHEFQNQLHVIDGLLELQDLSAAKSYVQRLSKGGAISPLDVRNTEVNAELAALLIAKSEAARQKGIDLQFDRLDLWPHSDNEDSRVRDDLLTIAGNFLDNALEATPAGGCAKFSLRRHEDVLQIMMDDSGDGVPGELVAQIFESGVTTKDSDRPRGFGLALVQQINQRRRGQVSVSDSRLGGARFVASVPLPGHSVRLSAGYGSTGDIS